MNLSDFSIKSLGKDLLEGKIFSNFVNEFMAELKEFLEKGDNRKNMDVEHQNKYSNYWQYQNFMEDKVAATIGLSRWGTDITYNDHLDKAVDESILELSKKEGTLYRKQFFANGSYRDGFYNIDKFENGKMTHTTIPRAAIPEEFENKDLIFQYKENGILKIRDDLKEDAIKLATQKSAYLRNKEQEINHEFKKEGHLYEAFEDDGYIFLKDLTEERGFSIEDIDFVVDNYQGEGKYKVINGEYKKIDR